MRRDWAAVLAARLDHGGQPGRRANDPQKYEEVRRHQIAQSAVWAHPAITGRTIIVSDADSVICWSF